MEQHRKREMKGRQVIAIAAVLFSLFGLGVAASSADTARPDVLMVIVDQWNPRFMNYEPGSQVITPNLDRLAKQGLAFLSCYSPSPVCVPARTSLITGRYPHNQGHGAWSNPNNHFVDPRFARFFHDVRAAGYVVGQVGKLHWHSGPAMQEQFGSRKAYYELMGVDFVEDISGYHKEFAEYLRERNLLNACEDDYKKRMLESPYVPNPSILEAGDHLDSYVARAGAKAILRQPKDKPLCIIVSFPGPHPPLDAPHAYVDKYDPEAIELPPNVPEQIERDGIAYDHDGVRRMYANYMGKMTLIDEGIGKLVHALQERGTWDETLFIFTADHGEMIGSHGVCSKGRPWEESARVPLLVRYPGQISPRQTRALAQLHDLYPTIVEAIGGTVSAEIHAVSLLPLAEARARSVREYVYCEVGRDPVSAMVRDDRYKWLVNKNIEYLFDMEADPYEMNNLIDSPQHAGIRDSLKAQMLSHLLTDPYNHAFDSKPKRQRMLEADKL